MLTCVNCIVSASGFNSSRAIRGTCRYAWASSTGSCSWPDGNWLIGRGFSWRSSSRRSACRWMRQGAMCSAGADKFLLNYVTWINIDSPKREGIFWKSNVWKLNCSRRATEHQTPERRMAKHDGTSKRSTSNDWSSKLPNFEYDPPSKNWTTKLPNIEKLNVKNLNSAYII